MVALSQEQLTTEAARHGLMIMGASYPDDEKTRILFGMDSTAWATFTKAEEYHDEAPDPLDRWSKRIIHEISQPFDGTCFFPSDGPPYHPFIGWALETGRFFKSPVGMLVHDRAGLMISIRGAIEFSTKILGLGASVASPCVGCSGPCRTACPANALKGDSYDVAACKADLDRPENDCMSKGCAARRACPVSQKFGRVEAQSAFHMAAFK